MGCTYFVNYTVKIRPDAVETLRTAIGAEEYMGDFFSLEDDVLSCESCDMMSFGMASAIEEFTKGPVSDAAVESLLVMEACDGATRSYGIGPGGAKAFSAQRLDEIRVMADGLTLEDYATLVRDVTTVYQLKLATAGPLIDSSVDAVDQEDAVSASLLKRVMEEIVPKLTVPDALALSSMIDDLHDADG